jgi:membrane-associated protease RseP (regulator of RpoE activity)
MRLLPRLLFVLGAALTPAAGEDANDYPATIASSEPPMIGMYPGSVPDDVARKQGIAPGTGVLVLGVMPGSMAESVGLKAGDVVTSFNGMPVNSYDEIVAARDRKRAGEQADVAFVHDGQARAATGTLGAWPHADDSGGSGGIGGLFHHAMDDARRRNEAAQQRDVDQLRDEIAKLRQELDREDQARAEAPSEGPWRLAWTSHPPPADASDGSAPAAEVAAADAPASGERAWRLSWSNAPIRDE